MEFLSRVPQFVVDAFPNPILAFTTISLMTLFLTILGFYIVRDYGVPPGPIGVPILGYWPFLNSETCHLKMLEFQKKYGDVSSFRVTGKLFINLASRRALREAEVTKADYFSERPSEFSIISKILENGVVFSNGEKWQVLRKFFLNQFRERGMTIYKENTAEAMDEMINSLLDDLRKNVDRPVDVLKILTEKSNSIIHMILFGPNSPVTVSEITKLQEEYKIVTSLIHSTNLLLVGNIAKYLIVPFLPSYKEGFRIHKKAKNTLLRMIEDHRKTFDSHNIRDIIDSFIEERNTRELNGDPTAKYFTDEALTGSLLQFVGDGVVNVATYVTMVMNKLLDYPEEQEKVYKELIEVVGEERNPNFSDRARLPYTNAFLLEAQRTTNFVPLFPSLECTRETTLAGYRIPKGAVTVINIYAAHNNPEEYKDPEKFNPLRFISKNGKPREESPVSFGMGKRVCLGEGFVLMQVFLFITAVVKNFKLSYYHPKSDYEVFRFRTQEIRVTPRK